MHKLVILCPYFNLLFQRGSSYYRHSYLIGILMRNERGMEASKTVKSLKVCHNKWLSKRRVFQVSTSSEEHLLLCPWNNTLLQHIIVFLTSVPGSLKQVLLPCWLNISGYSLLKRKRKVLTSMHQAVCIHPYMKAYLVL